jgi:hypothetical protein
MTGSLRAIAVGVPLGIGMVVLAILLVAVLRLAYQTARKRDIDLAYYAAASGISLLIGTALGAWAA